MTDDLLATDDHVEHQAEHHLDDRALDVPALEDPASVDPGIGPGADYPGADQGVPAVPESAQDVTVDPDSPTLHGDPDVTGQYHLWQGSVNGTCAPTSIAMVLEQTTGVHYDDSGEVVGRALEMGLITLDPTDPALAEQGGWSGMTTPQMVELIESYGLDAQVAHGSVDDLATTLDAGETVIVGVDADELWSGTDDDATDGGQDDNHAVVVTGIDTGTGMVYVDDPAYPEGHYAIPIAEFEQAWDDSGNEMILTEVPAEPGTDAPPTAGPTVLPFTFVFGPTSVTVG